MFIEFLVIVNDAAIAIVGDDNADIDEIATQAIQFFLKDQKVEDVDWQPFIGVVPTELAKPNIIEDYLLMIPTTLILSNLGYHTFATRLKDRL